MKRLLTITLLVLSCVGLYAQTPNTLTGTWHIKSFQYGQNPEANEKNHKFNTYKSFTPTHFSIIEVDSTSGTITASIFGSYKFDNGRYTEEILYTSKESPNLTGKIKTFALTMEGENKMHISGAIDGLEISELWTRTPAGYIAANIKKSPLYILKDGAKEIVLNIPKDAPSPLSVIQQAHIAALEVLKDKSATDLYQDKGKYGVILITVNDNNLDEVKKDLNSKGYIL